MRAQLIAQLEAEIAGSDALSPSKRAELAGRLKAMPGCKPAAAHNQDWLLRIDRTAARGDAQLDGKLRFLTP